MFALRGIREDALALPFSPSIEELVGDPKRHFGGLEHRLSRREGPRLEITRAPAVLASITAQLEAWRAERGDDEALVLGSTVTHPVRLYQATDVAPMHVAFILVGCFATEAGTQACVVRCEQSQVRSRDGQPLSFGDGVVFSIEDELESVALLARVFKETQSASTLVAKERPRLLVVGGNREPTEKEAQAIGAAFGYSVELFGRPESNPARATQAIANRRDLVAIWTGSVPHRPDIVEVLEKECTKRGVPTLRLPSTELPAMLDDLVVELHSYSPPKSAPPGSMSEALELAKAACPNLLFLPEADRSAANSPFRRPGDVLEGVRAADEIVRRWRNGELTAGVHAALKEMPFRYGSDISPTAKAKYGSHYVVQYNGGEVTLGPHLKFGKKSPEFCARVYWYVDDEQPTFVVGHFGRHLPDDTG